VRTEFDWRLIQSFLAVLDGGSLLAAARQLGTSQPTVGRQLTELEAQLGTVLFERTRRGLRPTASAQILATPARQMAQGAHALQRSVQQQASVAGTVRITASQPVACQLLPPLLQRLQGTWPQVQVELVVSNAVTNLLEREADIALRMVRPTQSSLVARRIAQVPLVACASKAYLQRHGVPAQPSDLLHHRLVGFDTGNGILQGFEAMGQPVTREHFALRTDDMLAYWHAVRAGVGVGFVAAYVQAADPQVEQVLPGLVLPSLPIWLTVHREIRTSPRIRAVYDFLADAVPQALQTPQVPAGSAA
jgi:DNA-binding transcriptional LysR family regulator